MRGLLANLLALATFLHAAAGCFCHHAHGEGHEHSPVEASICPIVAGPHVHWDGDHDSPSEHQHEHDSNCHDVECAGLTNGQRCSIQLTSDIASLASLAISAAPSPACLHDCVLRPPDTLAKPGVRLYLLYHVLVV
jgi:hypothetical protein